MRKQRIATDSNRMRKEQDKKEQDEKTRG